MIRRSRALKRGEPPKRNPETTRAWERRSRKPIPAMSARRKREAPRRAAVRVEVLERDGGCTARGIAPGPCGSPFAHRPTIEVHEVIPRGRWAEGYLVPENCRGTCQIHHDWITSHTREAEALGLLAKAPQPGLTKGGRVP